MKISTKYRNNKYYHAERLVTFDRIHGGIGWPGERPGYIVIVGERGKDRFILAESTRKSFGDLLRDAVSLQQRLKVERWHTRYVDGAENYTATFNQRQFNDGAKRLTHIEETIDSNDHVQAGIETILDGVRPGLKTLHFFSDSSLPAELSALPTATDKIKITDYPAVSALGYVIQYFDEFGAKLRYVERENSVY